MTPFDEAVGEAWQNALRERIENAERLKQATIPITPIELRGLLQAAMQAASTPLQVTADDAERAAESVKQYLMEHTGFGTDHGEGQIAAYYGGRWITLDTTKIAEAALRSQSNKVSKPL